MEPITLSLCEDCIVAEAGVADQWPQPEVEPLTKVEGLLLTNDPACRDGECEGHFGRECDGCETRWAGNRYCYIGIPKED